MASERSLHIRRSVGRVVVVVDGAVFSGQHRVVVAPYARCGELAQNILGLMEGHQTHAKEGEAEAQNRSERLEMNSKPSDSHLQNFRGTDHVKMSVTTQKVSSQLGPGTT